MKRIKTLLVALLIVAFACAPLSASAATYTNEASFIKKVVSARHNYLKPNESVTLTSKNASSEGMDRLFNKIKKALKKDTGKGTIYTGDLYNVSWDEGNIQTGITAYIGDRYVIKFSNRGKSKYITPKQLRKEVSIVKYRAKKLKGLSTYKKVKAINKYLKKRASYSFKHGKLRHSGYACLVLRKCTCQGYSVAFYRIARQAGLSCRLVRGSNHMWNIVKVGKKWYHVDVTWNDTTKSNKYLLVGSSTIKKAGGHNLYSEFRTKAFKSAHPISKTDYKP